MELRQLTHFVGIANAGSYTKAAQQLNISQPALTRSVQLLEGRLNSTLFLRTSNGVEMTEDGATLFRHASLILNSMHAAREELLASAKGGYGEVRIGLASLFTNMLADHSVSECVATDSQFHASIQVGLYEQMERSLKDGALDVVISTSTEIEVRKDLKFEPLCEVAAGIVSGNNHPLANNNNLSMLEIRNADWVTLNQPHMEDFLSSFFAQSGLAAPKSRVRSSSLQMLRNIVRQQRLIGFLPLHWIKDDLAAGNLRVLSVPGTPIRRMAGIITRRNSLLNKGAEAFVEHMRTSARTHNDQVEVT